jgi:hypothetical protein
MFGFGEHGCGVFFPEEFGHNKNFIRQV